MIIMDLLKKELLGKTISVPEYGIKGVLTNIDYEWNLYHFFFEEITDQVIPITSTTKFEVL